MERRAVIQVETRSSLSLKKDETAKLSRRLLGRNRHVRVAVRLGAGILKDLI